MRKDNQCKSRRRKRRLTKKRYSSRQRAKLIAMGVGLSLHALAASNAYAQFGYGSVLVAINDDWSFVYDDFSFAGPNAWNSPGVDNSPINGGNFLSNDVGQGWYVRNLSGGSSGGEGEFSLLNDFPEKLGGTDFGNTISVVHRGNNFVGGAGPSLEFTETYTLTSDGATSSSVVTSLAIESTSGEPIDLAVFFLADYNVAQSDPQGDYAYLSGPGSVHNGRSFGSQIFIDDVSDTDAAPLRRIGVGTVDQLRDLMTDDTATGVDFGLPFVGPGDLASLYRWDVSITGTNEPQIISLTQNVVRENILFPPLAAEENRPQYLNYDDEAAPENPDGDTYNFDATKFTGPLTQVQLDIENLSSDSYTDGASIFFQSDAPQNGLLRHEVTHNQNSALNPNQLPEGAVIVGGDTKFDAVYDAGFDDVLPPAAGDEPAQIFELTTVIDSAAEDASGVVDTAQDNLIVKIGDLESQPSGIFSKNGVGGAIDKAAMQAHENINTAPDTQDLLEFNLQVDIASPLALLTGESPEPMLYTNTTVGTYLAIKAAASEELVIGDEGFYITPTLDDNGELLAYSVKTWLVTNEDGVYTAYITNVPEPASLMVLAFGAAMLHARRRR